MTLLDECLSLLERLIAIPSPSREETAVADFMETFLTQKGQAVHRVGNNLWCEAWPHDPAKPTLLLNSHLDTVADKPSWTRPPFIATWEGERLYGLGSNDAGGPLCCLIFTYLRLCQTTQSYNLILGLSCQEEVGGTEGIQKLFSELPPISLALVGEPTSMRAAIAEKGLMVLDCRVEGTSGHAAHDTGDNAIYKALPCIEWFRTAQIPKVSPLLGPVKMSVTLVQAGSRHNVIPDLCTFTVDVRVNDCYTNLELLDYIRQHVGCRVEPRSTGLTSSHLDEDHPVVEKCRKMGIELYGSPTLSDQSKLTCPSFKMGPGDSTRSHTSDEYILRSEIAQGLAVYFDLLNGLSL